MSNKYLLKLTLYFGNKSNNVLENLNVKFDGSENCHLWVNTNL